MRRGTRPNRPMNTNSSIHDLDRELDLLRRKRQMLESEYQSNQNTRSANNYDSQYSDYSNLYERPERMSRERKRSNPSPWQGPAAKRTVPSPWAHDEGYGFDPPPYRAQPAPPAPFPKRRRPQRGGQTASQPRAPAKPAPPAKPAVDLVLRDGDVPPLLKGRLELCLGALLKELKQRQGSAARAFEPAAALRAVKSRIRSRLHATMLNKEVGSTQAVLAAYYDKYPRADAELLRDLDGADAGPVPESMKKQFSQKINIAVNERVGKLLRKFQAVLTDKQNPAYRQIIEDLAKTEVNGTPEQQPEETTPDDKNTTESMDTSVDTTAVDTAAVDNNTAEGTNGAQVDTNGDDTQETEKVEAAATEEPGSISPEHEAAVKEMMEKMEKEVVGTVESVVKSKLKTLTNAVAVIIYAGLSEDQSFNSLKAGIKQQAIDKLTTIVDPMKRKPLHYVMIVGRPRLPKRPVMQTFLGRYNVASLKKHKKHGNLLFVGLADRGDYEQLLLANDTTLGTVKLTIKASENKKKDDEPNPDSKTETDGTTESDAKIVDATSNADVNLEEKNEEKSGETIDSSLDEQITNLITSIRNDTEYNQSDDTAAIDNNEEVNKAENAENINTGEV